MAEVGTGPVEASEMTPEQLPSTKVSGDDRYGNRGHAPERPVNPGQASLGSFELKLTGPAVWLLACGVVALLYRLAERLSHGG